MRIAVVSTSYPARAGEPGGHFVQREVEQYVSEGHHVRVFAPGPVARVCPGNPTVHWLRGGEAFGWPGVVARLERAPWQGLGVLGFLWSVRRALRVHQYDELVLHWLLPVAPLVLPARPKRCTVVVHGTEARILGAMPKSLGRRVLSRLVKQGAQLRYVSNELRSELEALWPDLGDHGWVQPAELTIPQIPREGLRARLGLAPGAFVAVVVGRLIAGKRVDVALSRAPVPENCTWIVVGDGPLLGELRTRFPNVRFTGQLPRDRALEWIASADVLVNASLHEGAPSAIREARALGTRVWSSAVGDVPEWAARDPGVSILSALS
jgi:teichuronic acid biosynthesis glycosyltransferase TuaC